MGEAGEGQNITHQQKKMGESALRAFRDRFGMTVTDEQLAEVPFLRLAEGSAGAWPTCGSAGRRSAATCRPAADRRRRCRCRSCRPSTAQLDGDRRAGDLDDDGVRPDPDHAAARQADRQAGRADRARTSRAPSAWRACSASSGSSSQVGQLYQPEDANQLMFYREDKYGQMLQEGINEAGAMSSWIAAATRYSHHDTPMIPFYIYYSMFGFQRVGDLAWAAGDIAGPRLPARRHRRADHAQRRGAAARGRPQPPDLGDHPQLRVLRPDLRLRGRGDRPGRAAADVRRAGGRLLLPHADERELRAPRHARGRARTGIAAARHVPAPRAAAPTAARRGPGCSCWAAARSCAR